MRGKTEKVTIGWAKAIKLAIGSGRASKEGFGLLWMLYYTEAYKYQN